MRQDVFLAVLDSPVKSDISMGSASGSKKDAPSAFACALGARLRHLRENVRKMSAEDVEAKSHGRVSASYLRRVEKGLNSPTAEMLQNILVTLGSNLGLFFEDMIAESHDIDAQDRRHQRTLQRNLEDYREETIILMKFLQRRIGE